MKALIALLILVVVIVGGYFLLKGQEATAPSEETMTSEETGTTEETSEESVPGAPQSPTPQEPTTRVVTYADSGFSPSALNIKSGDTVKFENRSSQNMWTASAVHPTHMLYGGTSLSVHCPAMGLAAFDACAGTPPGGSWSFTFTKAGTWAYHDHLHPSFFGKIIVE